jgi:division protein CdvB (Snf7/Vps24/ESCRT-III family)
LNIGRTLPVTQDSLRELKNQNVKFEQSCRRLDVRENELFSMIKGALTRKDNLRAGMYANELAAIRRLKQVFSQSQLAIECMSIRMESLLDLYNAIQLDPISEVIKEVVSDIQGISPELREGFEQLAKLAGETLTQARIGFKESALEGAFSATSPESVAILKEVSKTIEDSLTEAFPEPPITEAPIVSPTQAEEIAYGYEPTFSPSKTEVTTITIDGLSSDFLKMLEIFESKIRDK